MVRRMALVAILLYWLVMIFNSALDGRVYAANHYHCSSTQQLVTQCRLNDIDQTEDGWQQTCPTNIQFPDQLKPLVEKMLARSATFRRQCWMIGNAGQLQIFVKLSTPATNGYPALSKITKFNGKLRITVQLALILPSKYVELIGHEFEHAIEQVEGLNLKLLSAKSQNNVYRASNNTYETERAIQAGRTIASEYLNSDCQKR